MCWGPTYDSHVNAHNARTKRGVKKMAKAEILDLIPPHGVNGTCYAEGMSAKLVADPEYLPDMEDGPDSRWFCFEEDWVTTCMILSKDCGFTATQILEARETYFRQEAEDVALDDRGELT